MWFASAVILLMAISAAKQTATSAKLIVMIFQFGTKHQSESDKSDSDGRISVFCKRLGNPRIGARMPSSAAAEQRMHTADEGIRAPIAKN